MMKDLDIRYPTPEEVERHILEARKLRSAAVADIFRALTRSSTPKSEKAVVKTVAAKGVATA